MKLIIHRSKDVTKPDMETMVISYDMLRTPVTHMFISSNDWEAVYVEVTDDCPDEAFRYIILASTNIFVRVAEHVSEKCMRILTELFPEKAGAIRRAHLTNSDMRGVVPIWDADLYPDA